MRAAVSMRRFAPFTEAGRGPGEQRCNTAGPGGVEQAVRAPGGQAWSPVTVDGKRGAGGTKRRGSVGSVSRKRSFRFGTAGSPPTPDARPVEAHGKPVSSRRVLNRLPPKAGI